MAVELLIDESKYREALEKYNTELGKLNGYRRDLKTNIDRMTGATFSGTSVQPSIDKAKEALRAVEKAIDRAQKQRDSIEFQLNQSQRTGTDLERNMNDINIPNLFK